MEIGMQHFIVSDLPPEDQKTVRKFYFRMGCGYAALFALVGLSILARVPGAQLQAAKQARETPPASGSFDALASGVPNHALCAARDLKLIAQLNKHGEAQDVPASDLRSAFLTLVDARKICFAGRVEEALALYDGVSFNGDQTANADKTAQRQ
jgi:hypothetical protein